MIKTMYRDVPKVLTRTAKVTVSRFEADWNDLAGTTSLRVEAEFPNDLSGCWYWNPRFTVHCSLPTPAFFQEARRCQREWYQTLGRVFGSSNSRRVERGTQEEAIRRLTFGGLLVIHGTIIDPRQWSRMETDLGQHPAANITVTRRSTDLGDLSNIGLESLKQITRSEIEQCLENLPGCPMYVTPGITVTGPVADGAFFVEAQRRCREWHRRLDRELGIYQRKRLMRHADLAARMLVFHGTLMVDGLFFKPSHWPNRQDVKRHDTACPNSLSVISPKLLGLEPCPAMPTCPPGFHTGHQESDVQVQSLCLSSPRGAQ